MEAAKRFFRRVVLHNGPPEKITLDSYAASHRVVEELKAEGALPRDVELRSNAYLNNLIEQDHRRVKQRVGPMLGFKRFAHAIKVISGVELVQKIRKGQFNFSKLSRRSAMSSDP
jgi:transposase-like protein